MEEELSEAGDGMEEDLSEAGDGMDQEEEEEELSDTSGWAEMSDSDDDF